MSTLLTPQNVADALHIPIKAVYRLIREQRLIALRIGRRLRITESDLNSFIEESKNGVNTIARKPDK